jgi:hypothetical protein
MLKADSSTLKSESDVQRRKEPPITPSAVAFSRISCTTLTMLSIDWEGKRWSRASTK